MIKSSEEDFLPGTLLAALPDPREAKAAGSGPRRVSDVPIAEPWRDALLRLSLELPIDLGLEDITRLFLDRLLGVLPSLALGACIVRAGGSPAVLVRLPAGLTLAPDRDPTRLFPRLAEEQVFALEDGATGSTFHVACSPHLGGITPFHLQVAERAAQVLGTALARARLHQEKSAGGDALNELRAQLVQAEKLSSLGQIVAGVVHELNNPLTSILAYSHHLTRRLEQGVALEATDVERLRRITESAERVLKFSRDLVSYARPTPEAPTSVRLEDVVEQALRFCDHEFVSHTIDVHKTFAPDLPRLMLVGGQLTQVFVNLFTNAVHAIGERGGRLDVSAALDAAGDHVLIEVTDSGCGIPPEHLPQLFEPFFTTKDDGRGTGLGLSIVREILDAHGGSVLVRSTVGQGTTFRLTLPVHGR